MALSLRLRRRLTGEYASYHVVCAGDLSRARDVAAAAGVRPSQFAKPVVAHDPEGGYLMFVLPSDQRLDLQAVSRVTRGTSSRLASEEELARLFPDCDLGAMPPFGDLYGLRTVVDPCFGWSPEIVFQGGSHDELVAMRFVDYVSLARVTVASSCLHPRAPEAARRAAAPGAAHAAA